MLYEVITRIDGITATSALVIRQGGEIIAWIKNLLSPDETIIRADGQTQKNCDRLSDIHELSRVDAFHQSPLPPDDFQEDAGIRNNFV